MRIVLQSLEDATVIDTHVVADMNVLSEADDDAVSHTHVRTHAT